MDKDYSSSPTPFTPPTTEEDILSWLRLIRSARVGPATFLRLMSEHGSAAAALEALPRIAAVAGQPDYTPCSRATAGAELDRGRRIGAVPLFLGAPDYPAALAAIHDPPPVLWALGRPGNLALLPRPALAMVGARNASSLGLRMARRLAQGAGAQGLVVVSGLARGIDTEVHGAALPGGTIAVMAGGVDVIYPPENAALAAAIADQGLRLSEQPPGFEPQARHFPRRNRLIAGLSRAVLVVEAAEGSGSLITARDALDQGREVLAVPGHPLDPRAAGCNLLIRDGARLIRTIDDVIEALGTDTLPRRTPPPGPAPVTDTATSTVKAPVKPPVTAPGIAGRQLGADGRAPAPRPSRAAGPVQGGAARDPAPPPADPTRLHALILDALGAAPLAEDQLLRDLALPPATAAPALLFLELSGRIRRAPGGLLARA